MRWSKSSATDWQKNGFIGSFQTRGKGSSASLSMTSSVVWAGKKMGGKKWIILLPMIPPFYQPLREIPRQDRQKNGGRRIGDAGVPPSSLIRFTHPPGFASLSLFASLRSPFGQPPAGYLRYATVRFARLSNSSSIRTHEPKPAGSRSVKRSFSMVLAAGVLATSQHRGRVGVGGRVGCDAQRLSGKPRSTARERPQPRPTTANARAASLRASGTTVPCTRPHRSTGFGPPLRRRRCGRRSSSRSPGR